jgi:hypothetical protein
VEFDAVALKVPEHTADAAFGDRPKEDWSRRQNVSKPLPGCPQEPLESDARW